MNPEEQKHERTSGWALAVMLFVHLIALREAPGITFLVLAVLLIGAVLRWRAIYIPPLLGRVLLLLGVVLTVGAQARLYPLGWVGEVAGVAGALMLLRPMTAARGLKVLFCNLVIILSIALQPYASVDGTFVIIDVVAMMMLAEQIHRPPEVAVSIWVSLVRSLRVVIPVSIIVMTIFWLFPNFALPSTQILSGFAGDSLNPGVIAEIAQSRRVAMVARFPEGQSMPRPLDVYWRGQVLEKNDELQWSRDGGHGEPRSLPKSPPGAVDWRYSAEMTSNLGGILPVLDRAVSVEARRGGVEVVVQDLGASVYTTVGTGGLNLDVASAAGRVADAPFPEVAGGNLEVPPRVAAVAQINDIVRKVIVPGRGTAENLRSLGEYYRDSHFSYSMRPGKVPNLKYFLVSWRKGFCEHYAAASANLLRLGGVPARVVTGYRGGVWNPWLRTITVRDSEAHAWVEAWDERSRQWLRFDPTDYVAPDFTARLSRNLDSADWPWYRLAFSFANALIARANERVSTFFTWLESFGFWDYVLPVLAGGYAIFATIWLLRRWRRQRVQYPADLAARLLADLERRSRRRRSPGETPLAWLVRIGQGVPENDALRDFAKNYEAAMYGAQGANPGLFAALRESERRVRQLWKTTAAH